MSNVIDFDGARFAPQLLRSIIAYLGDPPESDFQAGYLAALLWAYQEGLGKGLADDRIKLAEALIYPDAREALGEE